MKRASRQRDESRGCQLYGINEARVLPAGAPLDAVFGVVFEINEE